MSNSSSPEAGDVVTERIPWEQLTVQPPKDRRMLWYGIAGGMLAVGLLAVLISRLGGSPGEMQPVVPAAAPAGTAVQTAVAEPAAAATPAATAAPAPAPAPQPVAAPLPEPTLLSEADLMAAGGAVSHLGATAAAEWFVLEFFTLDPSEKWGERVAAASGLIVPTEAAPVPTEAETVSYVEWTRARSVEQIGSDRFRVSVLMRRMVTSDGEVYRRLPAEEAVVEITAEPGGLMRAASLPVLGRPSAGQPRALPPESIARRPDGNGIDWPAAVLAATVQ